MSLESSCYDYDHDYTNNFCNVVKKRIPTGWKEVKIYQHEINVTVSYLCSLWDERQSGEIWIQVFIDIWIISDGQEYDYKRD